MVSFERAVASGYGVELDVRDLDGELVVSHDPPRRGTLTLDAVIDVFRRSGTAGTIAVNVKADGLQERLSAALAPLARESWFAFDMSVPDALGYARHGLPVFTRQSDLEPEPALLDRSVGVWLDDFEGAWLTRATVEAHLDAGRRVAIVSPELHGRDHTAVWDQWRRWPVWDRAGVALCTDHPTEAEETFA